SIEPLLAFRAHADQAGLAQLFEVLGRPRLTEARSLHKITRRPFPASQEFEQATAVRFGYGFKRAHAIYMRMQLYNCQGIFLTRAGRRLSGGVTFKTTGHIMWSWQDPMFARRSSTPGSRS